MTLAIILISSVVSAPILPLFGLPLYILTFPRPKRQWPSPQREYTGSQEYLIYSTLIPSLKRSLAHHPSFKHSLPGDVFLIRFERLLVVASIVEKGWDYAVCVMKGLELQGTSCHNLEARVVDDRFEHHSNISTLLTPLDRIPIECASETQNKLTGILDNPQTLKMLQNAFLKVLVWQFVVCVKIEKIPDRYVTQFTFWE